MKTIAVDDMTSEKFDSCLQESQEDRVLLTRNGSAVAVLVGVQNPNAPEIEVVDDPEFWSMIADRRKQSCLTSEELKRKMGLVP